jgi:hypothetical protein
MGVEIIDKDMGIYQEISSKKYLLEIFCGMNVFILKYIYGEVTYIQRRGNQFKSKMVLFWNIL